MLLDCTYSKAIYREDLRCSCDGLPTFVVEFWVDVPTALKRFRRRGAHPAIDLTDQIVSDRVRDYPYSDAAFRVDSTLPATTIVSTVASWLEETTRQDLMKWVSHGC